MSTDGWAVSSKFDKYLLLGSLVIKVGCGDGETTERRQIIVKARRPARSDLTHLVTMGSLDTAPCLSNIATR